ncbi:hypothetical protein THAOC_27497, partial [Thalassiosira oceanica]
ADSDPSRGSMSESMVIAETIVASSPPRTVISARSPPGLGALAGISVGGAVGCSRRGAPSSRSSDPAGPVGGPALSIGKGDPQQASPTPLAAGCPPNDSPWLWPLTGPSARPTTDSGQA